MRLIFILFMLLGTTKVWADAPIVESVSGASGSSLSNAASVVIYGGLAGTACTSSDSISTCNNCKASSQTDADCPSTSLCTCNTTRIYTGLRVRLTMKTAGTGKVIAKQTTTTFPTYANDNSSIEFEWSAICNKAPTPNSDCEQLTTSSDNTISITICFDANSNNACDTDEATTNVDFKIFKPDNADYSVFGLQNSNGIGAFRAFPGDEKIYLEGKTSKDIESSGTFPTVAGAKIKAVRVYRGKTNIAGATYDSAEEIVDLGLNEDSTAIDDNVVDGLENGQIYFFRIGLVDEANNVVQFFPNSTGLDASCGSGTTQGTSACEYSATPDQVLGLLSEDINCFVATAAYGSSFEKKLELLRSFRQRVLLPTKWGRKFVNAYYHYGPYAARYIADKPVLRATVRGLLIPFYGLSWLALKIGLFSAMGVALALVMAATTGLVFGMRRIKARA